MRKFFAMVALAATMTALPAAAQLKFGVKGGLNITDMSFTKDVFNASNQTGFFIGPTVKFTIPIAGLGIDAAALYDRRSAEIDDVQGNNGSVAKKKLKQQAINIPVNLRYNIGLGSMAGIYLAAGPQFGFNVGDKSNKLWDKDTEWKLSKSTFSVNLGAGVMLLKHLEVGANYNIVCGKTGEVKFLGAAEKAFRGRANTWQIAAAYYF